MNLDDVEGIKFRIRGTRIRFFPLAVKLKLQMELFQNKNQN
jgi:hypothetical protein